MLQFNFTPFPILETENLVLRKIRTEDAPEILGLRSDPEIMKYIPRPLTKTIEEAKKFIAETNQSIENNVLINWAITSKEDDKLIGMIGFFRMQPENFRAEVGYMLHPNSHGKGVMKEALLETIKYGFKKMKLHSIEAVIDPRNIGSEKLLQKTGFSKEAHFRENFYYDGEFQDTVIYSLLKTTAIPL